MFYHIIFYEVISVNVSFIGLVFSGETKVKSEEFFNFYIWY